MWLREAESKWTTGDLAASASAAREGLQRFEAAREPVWNAVFRVELARAELYLHHDQESILLLTGPMPIGLPLEIRVRHETVLAMAEARQGDMDRAAACLRNAEALHPEGAARAEMLLARGVVLTNQSRFEEARAVYGAALEGAREARAQLIEAQAANNLGWVDLQKERFDDAIANFTIASTSAGLVGNTQEAELGLGNLGSAYLEAGDYPRAVEVSETAAAKAAAVKNRPDEIQWIVNAGMGQLRSDNFDAAQALFQRALGIAKELREPEELVDTHTALAGFFLLHGQPMEARVHVAEALRLAADLQDRQKALEPRLLESQLLMDERRLPEAENRLQGLLRDVSGTPSYQWRVEGALARVHERTGRDGEAEAFYQRAIGTFHQQRATLKSVELQLPFLENGSDLYLDYMEHLIREGRGEAALTLLDQSRAETLASGLRQDSAGTQTNPRALAARLHATVLVYCLRPTTSYLWAITPTREEMFRLKGSTTLQPLLARHREALLASKDLLKEKEATGRQLYDELVGPASALIQPGSRVFLIADKDLGNLNFDTLVPPPAPGEVAHYWIEDVTLNSARSLRLLAAAEQGKRQHEASLLLIGDPIYRAGEFPALAHAAEEMASIRDHFPLERRRIADGAQAWPGSYAASEPGQFSYLHFVAHATANEVAPLDSAIILSHGGDAGAYRLYAREILEHPLRADLVTLSSCLGSGTRNYSGEGVVGLVWAFLRAGAHNVIGAGWEVSDGSTPQLMDRLYTELLAGRPPDQALRTAKLSLLHGGGVFAKPFYWASFQLYAGH